MLKTITLAILATTIVTGLSGCATLEQIVKRPTVTFESFDLTEASLLQGTALLTFAVTNPNPVGLRASAVTYDFAVQGKRVINGQLDQGVSLAAASTTPLTIPVTLRYADMFESLQQAWRKKHADYTLNGSFSVGPMAIPFSAEGRFDLPQLPQIQFQTLQVNQLSLRGADLICRLKVDNPNAFALAFKRLEYTLTLGGTTFAKAAAVPRDAILASDGTTMDLGISASFVQLGQSAYQLLSGNTARYGLTGGIVVDGPGTGERKIPIDLTGTVPIRR